MAKMTLEEMIEYYERLYDQSLEDLDANDDEGGAICGHIINRMDRYRQTADWLTELKELIDVVKKYTDSFDKQI